MECDSPQSWLSPLGQTLACVVTGLKRSMKVQYALENLQEKDLGFTRKSPSSQINFQNIP